ncbi:hypothetical protein EU555_31585 [Methylobacterium nonmethylotrophicum]|uniref:Uncharacterized protein n=1 Tax=Methylobacterium nonmethylotrophicum TaxID=1141884 RepID=A0A4Z0NF42_9HYPH|nr:hypothetical protein EU555_31585 [Methylobacterium nonmethylotrophicum]
MRSVTLAAPRPVISTATGTCAFTAGRAGARRSPLIAACSTPAGRASASTECSISGCPTRARNAAGTVMPRKKCGRSIRVALAAKLENASLTRGWTK